MQETYKALEVSNEQKHCQLGPKKQRKEEMKEGWVLPTFHGQEMGFLNTRPQTPAAPPGKGRITLKAEPGAPGDGPRNPDVTLPNWISTLLGCGN